MLTFRYRQMPAFNFPSAASQEPDGAIRSQANQATISAPRRNAPDAFFTALQHARYEALLTKQRAFSLRHLTDPSTHSTRKAITHPMMNRIIERALLKGTVVL